MFVGFTTDLFDSKNLHKRLSGAVFLLTISVSFLYSLEGIPYPAGAILLHSDGIEWSFVPRNYSFIASTESAIVVDHEDYELQDVNDLTSGEFDI